LYASPINPISLISPTQPYSSQFFAEKGRKNSF